MSMAHLHLLPIVYLLCSFFTRWGECCGVLPTFSSAKQVSHLTLAQCNTALLISCDGLGREMNPVNHSCST